MNATVGSVKNTQRRTTAQRRHSGVSLKHDRTDGTEKYDIFGTGDGRRDSKDITGQTNIFKAKLLKVTLTRNFDPNQPMTRGII